jgi:hypothetical protein
MAIRTAPRFNRAYISKLRRRLLRRNKIRPANQAAHHEKISNREHRRKAEGALSCEDGANGQDFGYHLTALMA